MDGQGQPLPYTVAEAEKAACLLVHLCNNHPFLDGNKRIAYLATKTFLENNGLELVATSLEGSSFVLSIAEGRRGQDEAVAWIGDHTNRSTLSLLADEGPEGVTAKEVLDEADKAWSRGLSEDSGGHRGVGGRGL